MAPPLSNPAEPLSAPAAVSSLVHPLATITGPVELQAPAMVGAGAVLEGPLQAGPQLHVAPGAFVGGPAQHRKGGEGSLLLGQGVTIREAATVHRGSPSGIGCTRLGDRVLVMAYAHVGHDCVLGNDVVLSNGAQVGGHVEIGDRAVLGARSAIHQFVRIGEGAMVAAGALVSGDVPPYTLVAGNRARIIGPNKRALQGLGESGASRTIGKLLRWLCPGSAAKRKTLAEVRGWVDGEREAQRYRAVQAFLAFVEAQSQRSLCARAR